jgi:hypothetical protein
MLRKLWDATLEPQNFTTNQLNEKAHAIMKQKYSMIKEIFAFSAGMKLKKHHCRHKGNGIIFTV